MSVEIPYYGLRAYALFFIKYGTKQQFSQSALDWVVSQSMKKKIFSLLLHAGWITKSKKNKYICISPGNAIKNLLEFKVQNTIKNSTKPYAFTGLSAIEIWSDYSYMQRGIERSPYFIKVLKKDLGYWKAFFNEQKIPNYIKTGSTVGEFVILIPVQSIVAVEKEGFKVQPLEQTIKEARENQMYSYPYNYMIKKYGA